MRLILLTFDVGELKILSKKESALFCKKKGKIWHREILNGKNAMELENLQ